MEEKKPKRKKTHARPRAGDEALSSLLNTHGYLSGETLSKRLGLSRAALWKRMARLREKGFQIEASPGLGYRLTGTPDLSEEELRILLKGRIWGELVFLNETSSTNDVAMELAAKGAAHGTVVIADSQTLGKGRLGRRWASPPGMNIYLSVILKPDIDPKSAPIFTLLSSVAAARALRSVTGLAIEIKWPNDLVLDGKKLGGILLELRLEPGRVLHLVIGMGINVNIPRSHLPKELKSTATSLLEETGRAFKRTAVVAAVLKELERELDCLSREGRGPILQRWRELSSTLGRDVSVSLPDGGSVYGNAVGIDNSGLLMLRCKDGLMKISAGDLTPSA